MAALALLGIAATLIVGGVAMPGILSTILIVTGIVVFVIAGAVWLRERRSSAPSPQPPQQRPLRTGYLGREGSKGKIRRVKFGSDLDIAIENAGDVEVEDATFSEPDTTR